MGYRWKCPTAWLNERVNELEGKNDAKALAGIIRSLITTLDHDDIQDLFQQEMDDDGYFDEEDTEQ